jgi:eukaryotic-like serine/threonine-protein kinase
MGGKLRSTLGVRHSFMRAPAQQVVIFGPFTLDLKAGELHRDGHKILLQEQPFLVLKMLLKRRGDVVTREELRRALWPNDTVVEFDQSINAAIKKLRLALQDSAEEPQYVETVARRGYRLIVPVQWSEPARDDPQEGESERPVAPPHDKETLTGKKVSHYRVLQVIGGGGMGVVYQAEDIKLGRRVALKFLPDEFAGDAAALQRFEREARAASALNHPNICTIHAVEEHEGQPFIVMELLEGHTLRDVLSQAADSKTDSSFRPEPLLDTALQIVSGLEAAHQKGIIHRDIKPANIFITSHGQAKILDFGLAKLHESESAEPPLQSSAELQPKQESNPLLTLTRTGVTVGTAAYMSPEQVRGEKLDPRTDLFSFGLVLYEMATRQRAFSGDTAAILHHAILNQTPSPVRDLNPHIPANLSNIINRAIQKDRTARYQTASEIRADLADLQGQLAPRHMSRARLWGLGVAAAILMASFFFLLTKKLKTVSVAPEIKMRQLTTNSTENPVGNGAISPDGNYLAYIDTRGMHIKSIDTGETRTVPKPEALKNQSVKWENALWFPDSNRFLVNLHPATEEPATEEWDSATNSIWVFSVLGGAPTKVRDHAIAWSVSPDGSLVSFGTNNGKLGEHEIWLMGPNGEQARKIQESDENHAICCLIWSRDGKQYLYISTNSSGDTVLSRNVKGGPAVTLFQPSELATMHDLLWLHDGRVVHSLSEPVNTVSDVCNYWTLRIDLATGRHLEEPRRLTNWPNFCVSSSSVTNNDKQLAFVASSGFYTTYVADLEAGGKRLRNIRHFTLEDSDDQALGWTPDGGLIIAQNRGSSWRVYKQSLDSDTQEPIASSTAGDWLLTGATSADGKWYIANVWPKGESVLHPSVPFPIFRIPLAGGTTETILQVSRRASVSCARRPSNTCVIAQQSEDRKQMIVALFDPMKGSGPELTRFDLDRELGAIDVPTCVLSPDGTRLAIKRGPESPIEIHSLHGQLIHKIPSQSAGRLFDLSWSADQKGFFVTRTTPGGNERLHLDFQGQATSLRKCGGGTLGLGGGCGGFPSPDGRHLAIIERDQSNNMWLMENF